MPRSALLVALALVPMLASAARAEAPIDFNRDVRPILSNNCFQCHGPDDASRKAKLRLDTADGIGTVIVRGKPDESDLLQRVLLTEGKVMPPKKTGKVVTKAEADTLRKWIAQGAPFAGHWAYTKPTRPAVPTVKNAAWARTAIDRFLLARLEKEGLAPQAEADRHTLIRRVTLDLTGLPPTPAEVEAFVNDKADDAYEKLVDRLLQKPAFGEHWARMWLDLARYADSAGYADDPPRVIWGYRDWVIKAFNDNQRFDQFTLEQIAGDLLPNPTTDQLVATGFHRNTPTNNEGGTNDEEFRNVAVVDRVNTTMAVWMGTSMACAQCHTHKYDPISQKEYFRFFAFFNNTQDADRKDESPFVGLFSEEQKRQKLALETQLAALREKQKKPTPEILAAEAKWLAALPRSSKWDGVTPATIKTVGGTKSEIVDGLVKVAKGAKTDTYTVELPLTADRLTGLRLETPPNAGNANNFVVTGVKATLVPPGKQAGPAGRFVRIEMPGKGRHLMLAEVQVFSGADNVALKGEAKQSSTAFNGDAKRAIDNNTNGIYFQGNSVSHTAISDDPWWEVDLKGSPAVDRIVLWNRTDNGPSPLLRNVKIQLLDENRQPVWQQEVKEPPSPSKAFELSSSRPVVFTSATADYSQANFDAANVLNNAQPKEKGWAVGGAADKAHVLTLAPAGPVSVAAGSKLVVTIEQQSKHENHTLGQFRLALSADPATPEVARLPADVAAIIALEDGKRSAEQKKRLTDYYLASVPELKAEREQIAAVEKQLAELKPSTTVPIFRELADAARRKTRVQLRGNFLDLDEEVTEGVPAALHPLPKDAPLNRLTLARWLIDADNPLTARVTVNRFWEEIFGVGLVRTSEEFGSQGELPSHSELLDWLAVEFREGGWDVKGLLRLMVTSSAYRQSAKTTAAQYERDPENRLLARGPRVRLTAEMVRDQALAVSGLLSEKMYGASVRPARPQMGLSAAFGGTVDWQPSPGEDRFRRALYTEVRRSNPYPSMLTFDATNREVCTLRRARTNTPLQALTTLNDPVYVEAAQSLARKLVGATPAEKAAHAIRVCLARPATEREVARLVELYNEAKAGFAKDAEKAKKFATEPLGMPVAGTDLADLAAWTAVANVVLNLDEMFLKR